jgi:PAS domain S-box-containing protein
VILRNLDGTILASGGTAAVGGATGRQVMQLALRDALARSGTGHYWGGGAVDGVNRLVSYRTSRDMPIITMVGLAEVDIFATYERNRIVYFSAAVIVTLLILLGTIAGIHHQLRLTRSSTARPLAEKNLEHARAFLHTVIENLPLPIVVKDPDTLKFVLINRAYETFMGMPREQLMGKTVYQVFPPEDAELIVACDEAASSSDKPLVSVELAVRTPTNGLRVVTTSRLVVRDDKGGPSQLIAVIEDVTDRRAAEKKIIHMAHHDALTDLPNRALLQERLEQG